MPPCTLRLTLDSTSVRGGETLTGAVEIQATESFDCRALTVGLLWRAKSRWQTDSATASGQQRLFDGRLEAGVDGRYPFALNVPPSVWTYQGTSFQLNWYVDAKADIPSAADVHAETPIEITPAESIAPETVNDQAAFGMSQTPSRSAAGRTVEIDRTASQLRSGCLVAVGLMIIVSDLVGLLVALIAVPNSPLIAAMVGVFTLVSIGVGGTMVYLGLRSRIAQSRLGEVRVDVSPRLARPGEELQCAVSFRPQRDLEIAGVSATLRLQETVWRPARNGRRADRKTVSAQVTQLEGRRLVRAGEPVDISGSVDLPGGAALSLNAPYHWVQWIVAVRISLMGWVDYQSDEIVIVAPVARDDQSETV